MDCTYCPEPGADVCVRIHVESSGSGLSVFAHEQCATEHGAPVLYRVLPEAVAQ